MQSSESIEQYREQIKELPESKKIIGSKPNTAVPTQRGSEPSKKATPNSKAMIPSKGSRLSKPEAIKQPNSVKKPTDSGDELVFKPMTNGQNGVSATQTPLSNRYNNSQSFKSAKSSNPNLTSQQSKVHSIGLRSRSKISSSGDSQYDDSNSKMHRSRIS